MTFPALPIPIVQAPMGGGPSTPELAAGVSGAGGLGFLAMGYKSPEAVREEISAVRARTRRPFGVNLFVPPGPPADPRGHARYLARLEVEAERLGVALGQPRRDDDAWDAKLALLQKDPVAVVSFTFGCPPADVVERLQACGTSVWVTVTDVAEGRAAAAAGADALVAQGLEAGAHRGAFEDRDDGPELALLPLLQLLGDAVDVPLVAAGGIATGHGVAAALCAGARAAQLGTAFMRCPEAGTPAVHRDALARETPTRLTRAFTGRRARALVNRFVREHEGEAPIAYPEIHHVTTPLRAAARRAADADTLNLWAGQAHELAVELPAAELVRVLADDARAALRDAERALRPDVAAAETG
jgi:nitronate monooxygenase